MFILLFSLLAWGAETPQVRLIETGPSMADRKWLSEGGIEVLSAESHEAGRCAGFFDVTHTAAQWDVLGRKIFSPGAPLSLETASVGVGSERKPWIARLVDEIDAQKMMATVQQLNTYHTRHARSSTGVEAAEWIASQFRVLAAGRTDIEVDLIRHRDFGQPSVRARILGKGARAHEVLIIGAHEDSIRQWDFGGRGRAPGADDDASGVATVLETFRIVAQSGVRPERTLEFITYAGEELGLLGSQEIALDYKNRGVAVVAVLQFDMTMVPGPQTEMHFITDHTNLELSDAMRALTDLYVGVRWSNTECGYACSDHASWTRAGFRSAFPFESSFDGLNSRIHTERDLPDSVQPDFGAAFAKLSVAFLGEFGGNLAR